LWQQRFLACFVATSQDHTLMFNDCQFISRINSGVFRQCGASSHAVQHRANTALTNEALLPTTLQKP